MPTDDKQFGRQRSRKPKPILPSAGDQSAAAEQPITPKEKPSQSQNFEMPFEQIEERVSPPQADPEQHFTPEELQTTEITHEPVEPPAIPGPTATPPAPKAELNRSDSQDRQRPLRDGRRGRPDRPNRDRQERPDRAERTDRPERPERSDKTEKIEKPDRTDRINRPDRQDRTERFQTPDNRGKDLSQRSRDNRPARRPFPERGRVRVSVIIPAYNEEGNIKPLLEQFNEVIHRAGSDWEVIIVDDGSKDKTAERARDAAIHYHWLRVLSYSHNRGLTAALDTGFQSARGSIYVFYPADMQYHPQDIPKMINRIDRGADVVTGWKQGSYQKKFVSYVYNRLCRSLFHVKVHDLNSVKAFKKEVLEKINLRQDWHRYMIVLASEQGFVIDEVKVPVYPRHSGTSKFGTGRILGGVLDLLSVKFQVSFTKKPLRFFGTWGLFSMLLGLITGLIGIYMRFFTPNGSRLWLFFVILFVLAGLMLFSLGFLAEVIVALREEIESLKAKK